MIGIGEFQKNASSLLKRLQGSQREGLIVSHNKPQAIIMSLDRYEELKRFEENCRAEEEEVLGIVQQGNEEFKSDKTFRAKSLKAFL